MSLKRLGELRDLVLGSDHEPDYVLRSFMKKESQKDTSLVVESPEKLAKIVPAEEKTVLSLEEVEIILKSGQTLTQEFLENQICPAILQNKKGLSLYRPYLLMGTLKSVCSSWFALISRDIYEHTHMRVPIGIVI